MGAFLLNGFWAIGNRTWIGLLAFIPIFNLIMPIILGIKGREWAWKNNSWESVAQFNTVQRKWSLWGFIILGILMSVGLLVGIGYGIYRDRQTSAIEQSESNSNADTILINREGEVEDVESDPSLANQQITSDTETALANSQKITVVVLKLNEYSESGDGYTFDTESGKSFYVYNAGGTQPHPGEEYLKPNAQVCLSLLPENSMGDIESIAEGACDSKPAEQAPAQNQNRPELSEAAKKAISEGFVEIYDQSVLNCTDAKMDALRKEIGKDLPINYDTYNSAAVDCGFNI